MMSDAAAEVTGKRGRDAEPAGDGDVKRVKLSVQPSTVAIASDDNQTHSQLSVAASVCEASPSHTGDDAKPKRKRRWGDVIDAVPALAPTATAKPAVGADMQAVLAAQKAAIQRAIAEKLKGPQVKPEPQPTPPPLGQSQWIPLRLDSEGRQIDDHGNIVAVTKHEPDLKSNKSPAAADAKSKRAKFAKPSNAASESPPPLPNYIDTRLHVARPERQARDLNFVTPGKYSAQLSYQRMQQLEQDLKIVRFDERQKKLAETREVVPSTPAKDIPSVDWWDAVIVNSDSNDSNTAIIDSKITAYVYHPVPINALTSTDAGPMPVILTLRERKKLSRRRKLEKQNDERERIRLGLMAPPEPKLRISNLLNVLMNENISDPSEAERRVRAVIEARQIKHFSDNESRKLTPQQKKEKYERKFHESLAAGCEVALLWCPSLRSKKVRYQIDVNTRQWNLTGMALMLHTNIPGLSDSDGGSDLNLVLVEGGKRGMKKMLRLMTHRINWAQRDDQVNDIGDGDISVKDENMAEDSADDGNGEASDNDSEIETNESTSMSYGPSAVLVWRGVTVKPVFQRFSFELCRGEGHARDTFAKFGVEHFYDAGRNYSRTLVGS